MIMFEGFRCKIAWNSGSSELVGFAVGYASEPGYSWHDNVAEALGVSKAKEWLSNAFEWVEFAVAPAFQRQRIRDRLQNRLLHSLSHQTAILQAHGECISAINFYQKHGWVQLCQSPMNSDDQILGKRLT
jgi:GNAT superfamily N-acetyltransferase